MCTIVAIRGRHPHYPLIVAANRDEFYARAAAAPRIVGDASPRVIAGIDLEKGGSWMGANEHGLFVALTNQRTHRTAHRQRASRGEVVLEALSQHDVAGVDELLDSLDPRAYNAFNLIYGSAGGGLRVAYARDKERAVERASLGEGVWVLPNDRIGSIEFPKAEHALALVAPLARAPWDELSLGLARALGDHEKPPLERIPDPPPGSIFDRSMLRELQALCVHTAVYGTRSSTLLALEPGRVARYLFADGPPCRTPFRDLSALIAESPP